METITVALIFTFSFLIDGKILRAGQHDFYADFVMIDSNIRVIKNITDTFPGIPLHKCSFQCMRIRYCQSFNYHETKQICELLGNTKFDDVGLEQTAVGWAHYETDEDASQIGEHCKWFAKCASYQVCEDTFQNNPKYRCTCREHFSGDKCDDYEGPGSSKENFAPSCHLLFARHKSLPDKKYWVKGRRPAAVLKECKRKGSSKGEKTGGGSVSPTEGTGAGKGSPSTGKKGGTIVSPTTAGKGSRTVSPTTGGRGEGTVSPTTKGKGGGGSTNTGGTVNLVSLRGLVCVWDAKWDDGGTSSYNITTDGSVDLLSNSWDSPVKHSSFEESDDKTYPFSKGYYKADPLHRSHVYLLARRVGVRLELVYVNSQFNNDFGTAECRGDLTDEEGKGDGSGLKDKEGKGGGSGTTIANLDFGQPKVNVQDHFLKIGLPDNTELTFTGTFPCYDRECSITVSGYSKTRGSYRPIDKDGEYARLSNLLRSSFVRNKPGTMTVKITGLKPSTDYQVKTYHHSTQYGGKGVEFSLEYDGNEPRVLQQSGDGRNPDPPLIHTESVTSSAAGNIIFTMTGITKGGLHMDLNGLQISEKGTTIANLDFGQPKVNVQDNFLKIGLPDGEESSFTGTFPCYDRSCSITVSGYIFTRGNYDPIDNGGAYARLSNLLRSSFNRNKRGTMTVKITGLKPSTDYQVKTYHHSTQYGGKGVKFSLEYDGNKPKELQQSGNGRNPDPPLIHTENVTSSAEGNIIFTMTGRNKGTDHMDLNGLQISERGRGKRTTIAKLDFGQPEVNVQDDFLKMGLPDGGKGDTFTGTFPCYGRRCSITVSGYQHRRGNFDPIGDNSPYASLSNLLRSSFVLNGAGAMTVKITGLKPSTNYQVKTYHHSTRVASRSDRGAAEFSLKYNGNKATTLKQSSNGKNPDPPLMHTEDVISGLDGSISFTMTRNATTAYGHTDLNGLEIFETDYRLGFYDLDGYTNKPPLLILEGTSNPFLVKDGTKMKVWYKQGLDELNALGNNGKTCASVYAKIYLTSYGRCIIINASLLLCTTNQTMKVCICA